MTRQKQAQDILTLIVICVVYLPTCSTVSPICENATSGLTCICPKGYSHQTGECQDIDECSTLNGRCQQSCVNQIGNYRCECQIGYQLANDNHRCDDFDECSINRGDCAAGRLCINTWGGSFCAVVSQVTAPEASSQENHKLLNESVMIGLLAWLAVITILIMFTFGAFISKFPSRGEKSSPSKEAEYTEPKPDYFSPDFWPQVSVRSRDSDVHY